MPAKPFRRSVVLLVVLTLVALAPSSMAAAGPLAARPAVRPLIERGAAASRPVTGLWSLMLALAERVASIAAAGTVGTTPTPTATDPDKSGAVLDPNGTN